MADTPRADRQVLYGPGADHTGRVNHSLPPRGVSGGVPPKGLRNWDCAVDGHEDPDNSGLCIHCGADLDVEWGPK